MPQRVWFTATEQAIYEVLKAHPNRPLSEAEIYRKAKKHDDKVLYGWNSVRWHIIRMRKKLPEGKAILAIRNRGYVLTETQSVCPACGTLIQK